MPQSLSQIYTHIIFSTKDRRPLIDPDYEDSLFAYIGNTIRRNKGIPVLINGTSDHVHILTTLPRTITVSKYIEEIKRNSSRWCKTISNSNNDFSWQRGYGIFSVSYSNNDSVIEYIKNQKEHHKKISFKEEYILFLQKYNIEYDDKYVWD